MHVCNSVDEFLRYAGNDRTGLIVGGVLIIGGVDRSDWVRQGDAGGKRILLSWIPDVSFNSHLPVQHVSVVYAVDCGCIVDAAYPTLTLDAENMGPNRA